MKITLRRRVPGELEFGLIYGGLALLALGGARLAPVTGMLPSCAFLGLFGFPCPTCGATRSLLRLSEGDLFGSLLMNPLVFSAIGGAALYFFYALTSFTFQLPRVVVHLTDRQKIAVKAGGIILFLANWVYLAVVLR